MPEDRAHLAGGEIEDRAAMGVIDVAPLGALDDDGRELGPIADEMIACLARDGKNPTRAKAGVRDLLKRSGVTV